MKTPSQALRPSPKMLETLENWHRSNSGRLAGSGCRPRSLRDACGAIALICLCAILTQSWAIQLPDPGDQQTNDALATWSFNSTNSWLSDNGFAPAGFTNLDSSNLGNGNALLLDSTNAAWLCYNVFETNGQTNLTVDEGSIVFWFAPSWSGTNEGGTGPGVWGRLIEVGTATPDATYGWFSLFTDPEGVNLYFSAQADNGISTNFLSFPIDWTTNRWHLISLTYSATNTALYLDGDLATNGTGVTCGPGSNVLANGFYLGSASNGAAQAHGMFDDLATYNYQLDPERIQQYFVFGSMPYYLNPMNRANVSSASPSPTNGPTFCAITGAGFLQCIGTNSASCVTSTNVWLTNVVATPNTNGTATVQFEIAGGSNSLPYDVFANAILGPTNANAFTWAWMGQGYHCRTYLVTNLPLYSAFIRLGTPLDTDGDGLTDAYENLVSHTDPTKADTSGDGMFDGWKVMWGLNPLQDNPAQNGQRANYGYTPAGWLQTISNARSETLTLDAEGNVQQAQ